MSEGLTQVQEEISEQQDDDDTASHDSLDEKPPMTKARVSGVGFGNIFESGTVQLKRNSSQHEDSNKPYDQNGATLFQEPKTENSLQPRASSSSLPVKDSSSEPEMKTESNPKPRTSATSLPVKETLQEKALVLFPYKAEHEDELNLVEGEEVVVLEKEIEDPGWYRGESHGKIGVFPDNFVRLIPSQRPKKPPPPSREVLARSVYMSGTDSPTVTETPMSQSTENVSVATSDTVTISLPARPPPLPPKDSRPVSSHSVKMGMGAIPNLELLKNQLKSSQKSGTESGIPSRSLFYISPQSKEKDQALLIVPESGASVTTVLFHPTKDRARPARKHGNKKGVSGEGTTKSESSEVEIKSEVQVGLPMSLPVSVNGVKSQALHENNSEERTVNPNSDNGKGSKTKVQPPPVAPPPLKRPPPPSIPKKPSVTVPFAPLAKPETPSPASTCKFQNESTNAAAVAAVNARCDRLDKLVHDLRRDLNSAQNDVRRLTLELDGEKKARLAVQVDLERVRQLIDKQLHTPSSPLILPSNCPDRPSPTPSNTSSLQATSI